MSRCMIYLAPSRLSWSIKPRFYRLRCFRDIANPSIRNIVQISQKYSQMNSINAKYEEAVKCLNGLQSNSDVLEKIRKTRKIFESNNLEETLKFLDRVGLDQNKLDKLPVIHIAGTKGKGSTCAFIESILREHGLKTGFYSSPHLVAVRERIRINGRPVDKEDFVHYFWETYRALSAKKSKEDDMPGYFKFLTIMAFSLFLKENVDVAIMEVGIGGQFDCTNVIRRPVVCGITSLDMDHTSQLGDSIESIAWHKAGIMKCGVPTFIVPQQSPSAMQVFFSRAVERKSIIHMVPPLENYDWAGRPIHLGLNGFVQFLNASLALQISHFFLRARRRGFVVDCESKSDALCGSPFSLSDVDRFALGNVVWPGRSQVLTFEDVVFFLDGAHTQSSIGKCIEWFQKMSKLHSPQSSEDVYRILVFNITGDRDHNTILKCFSSCSFDAVVFTTNLASKNMAKSSDQRNLTVSDVQQIGRCQKLRKCWLDIAREGGTDDSNSCFTFCCIEDVLRWLSIRNRSLAPSKDTETTVNGQPRGLREAAQVQVLVTGSLHLVGGFLSFLDPSLSCSRSDVDQASLPPMTDSAKKTFTV